MTAGADERSRRWHAWSVWKTRVLLSGYLPGFTTACSGAPHRTFLDCFAGTDDAVDVTGQPHTGSPRLALQVTPIFTHAVFFELKQKATALDQALRAEFPDRQFKVVGGDCNEKIGEGLNWLRSQGSGRRGPQLGPVFAFLDPDAMELDWATVETIAKWTGQQDARDWSRQGRMPELLVLFPTGRMRRTLPVAEGTAEAPVAQKKKTDRLFGDEGWRSIYEAQRKGLIQGEDSWVHYVDHYRSRLVELGYTYTSAIEVRNTSNVIQHDFIFATCNPTGSKIMRSVQNNARAILPAMVQEEKWARRDSGHPRLFEESDVELERYAADPARWARFRDDPPRAFEPLSLDSGQGRMEQPTLL